MQSAYVFLVNVTLDTVALLLGGSVCRSTEWHQSELANFVEMVRHEARGEEILRANIAWFVVNFNDWLFDCVVNLIAVQRFLFTLKL